MQEIERNHSEGIVEKIGISQSFLSEIENERYNITLELLCKIARALDTPASSLFEENI